MSGKPVELAVCVRNQRSRRSHAVAAVRILAKLVQNGECSGGGETVNPTWLRAVSLLDQAVELSIGCLHQAAVGFGRSGVEEVVEDGIDAAGCKLKGNTDVVRAPGYGSAVKVPIAGREQSALDIRSIRSSEVVEH